MKCLESAHARNILSSSGLLVEGSPEPQVASSIYPCVGRLTAIQSRPYILAKAMANYVAMPVRQREVQPEPCDVYVLWITEFGIWPSSENMHLYYALRQWNGDAEVLNAKPVHVFNGREIQNLISFLHVSLDGGWGGYLFTRYADFVVYFSHDGYLDVYAASAKDIEDHFGDIECTIAVTHDGKMS